MAEAVVDPASRQATISDDFGNFEVDEGLLVVSDLTPIDSEAYNADKEEYLTSIATSGTQALLSKLFSLPSQSSGSDGPLAMLPKPKTILPRAKPLPKPKPQTKWEKFAKAKGINKTVKDRKVFDEDTQEWVNRWGRDGKNKEKEEQWIQVLPSNAPDDYNPATAARKERKDRVAKNEQARLANIARAERGARKSEIEKTLLTSKKSTASMGKFDKKLEGEPKVRGMKRKFAPNEQSVADEKKSSMAIISKIEGVSGKRSRTSRADGNASSKESENVLNVRKAIRFASKGKGPASMSNGGSKGKFGARKKQG